MPDDQTLLDPVEYDKPEEPAAEKLRAGLQRDLDADTERELIALELSDHEDAIADRLERETRWAQDHEQYYGILPDKVFPWKNCSNLHVPLTMTGVEMLKPRLSEAVMGDDRPIMAIPTESMDEDRQERTELFLNWQVQTELDVEQKVNESAHLYLMPGTVVAKTAWRVDERHVKAIKEFPPDMPMPEVLKACFGDQTPREMEKTGEQQWSGWLKAPNGARRDVTMTVAFLEDALQVQIDTTTRTYDAPDITLIPIEDFIMPANGGHDIQRMPWCQHRLWWEEGKLRQMARLGMLRQASVEKLLRGQSPSGDDGMKDATEVRDVLGNVEGVEIQGASSVRGQQYEVLECYRRYDVDGDGWPEEIITWVAKQMPDEILGWDYLDNVFAHGRRPFRRAGYSEIPGKSYARSFPEVVKDLQEEINTIHNQRVDFGTISMSGGGWFRASSTMEPGTLRVAPFEYVPIDDPQRDIKEREVSANAIAFGQNEEALLWQMFERLTGITDLSLGRQPNRVGASRTATGVASLLSEAGLRFKTSMKQFQKFWREIFSDVLALNQQYLPPGKEFRVTGRLPEMIRLKSAADIAGRYDIRLSTTTESMNRQLMREDITAKLQFALNPLTLQMGIVGPKGVRYIARKYFLAYGETDPDRILEPERPDSIVRTPAQELAMWVNGQDPQPSMAEDLMAHYQEHQMQRMNPVVQEVLGPAGMARMDKHLAATQQLLQMQAAVMAQAQKGPKGPQSAVVGQQANNAAIGRQQGMAGPGQPAPQQAGMGGTMSPQGPRG